MFRNDIIFYGPFPGTEISAFIFPFKNLTVPDSFNKQFPVFLFYFRVGYEIYFKPNALQMFQIGNHILTYLITGIIVSKKTYQF